MADNKEVVSVGLHWLTDEQAARMMEIATDERNQARGASIAKVADQVKSGVYKVESDDNLGTPF